MYPQVQRQRRGLQFLPGLSALDAICNVGAAETRKLILGWRVE
jgi:hypothetical protein